jgi:hypothetical protein
MSRAFCSCRPFLPPPLPWVFSPLYTDYVTQIQMKDNQIRKAFNNDLYEILELNVSKPIMFQRDSKNQQTYTEKNNQVILVVPKEPNKKINQLT